MPGVFSPMTVLVFPTAIDVGLVSDTLKAETDNCLSLVLSGKTISMESYTIRNTLHC